MKLLYTKEMNGHIPEETFFFFKLDFKDKFILINKTFNLKRLFAFKEKQYQNKLRRPSVFCRITCSCKSTILLRLLGI